VGHTEGTTSPTDDVETSVASAPDATHATDATSQHAPSTPAQTELATGDNQPARTLLTGASLQSTWRLPGLSDKSSPPSEASTTEAGATEAKPAEAQRTGTLDGSGVHSLPPPPKPAESGARPAAKSDMSPNADPQVLALADTQKSAAFAIAPKFQSAAQPQATPEVGEAGKQPTAPQRGRGQANRNLGRTLRMEIKIARDLLTGETAPTTEPPSAAGNPAAPRASAGNRQVVSGATQRIGTNPEPDVTSERAPARVTDPFGHMAKNRAKPQGGARNANTAPPPLPQRPTGPSMSGPAQESGSGSIRPGLPPWAARSISPGPAPSRRAPRPGDRTVITRRGGAKRDWLFMGLFVAALGTTAAMLLSYQSGGTVEGAALDATNVEHAVNAAADAPATTADGVLPANVTEIVSNPPSAEVLFGGAVIGNTPVRVARADFDAEYLVRLNGHDPQLVRVSANSPAKIVVSLKPVAQ
jgi:hypothetical protein